MNCKFVQRFKLLSLAVACALISSEVVHGAGDLDQAIAVGVSKNKDTASSQKKIERLDDEARRMLEEYRQNMRNAETLKKYNDHLSQLLESQETEKKSLEKQLGEIEVTQREIVPLMLRMLDSLESFVQLDLPFLPEERAERIQQLNEMILRADVTNAEKFRRVLEAYQVEAEYGRTIEAYRENLKLGDTDRPVDFLRLGRVALFYQSLDGGEAGFWNRKTKQWEQLPDRYLRSVKEGLRVARKEAAPNLLTLPVRVPQEAK